MEKMKQHLFTTLLLLSLGAASASAGDINPLRDSLLYLGYDKVVSAELSSVSAASLSA